jgi:hypothetical protein
MEVAATSYNHRLGGGNLDRNNRDRLCRFCLERSHPRFKPVTTYADIALGDSKATVVYSKGPPSSVLEDATDKDPAGMRIVVSFDDMQKANKSIEDYRYWIFETKDAGRVDVDFSSDNKNVIRIFCYATKNDGALRYCPPLLGISAGADEEEIITKLGKPSKVELDERSYVKALYYAQWSVTYYLQRKHLYALEVQRRPTGR